MLKTIIADTSCLIILSKIGKLDLLQKMYGSVSTTSDIASEFGEALPDWILIEKVADQLKQQLLEIQLGKGESSAIVLAIETPGSVVILDDYKARKIAEKLGVIVTGTLGIIVKAKSSGFIPSIKPFLAKIRDTNFRISIDLELQALNAANEL